MHGNLANCLPNYHVLIKVCPHHRGHRIGENLINFVKQKALDLNFNELYLLAFDPTIPQWYAKLGWMRIGEDQLFGHRVEVIKIALQKK